MTWSPSLTARLTIWPITRADMSTLRWAWILPLAVTLETRSIFSTLAVVTRGTSLSLFRMAAVRAPMTTTATTDPTMIFVFFDMASNPPVQGCFPGYSFLRKGPRKVQFSGGH